MSMMKMTMIKRVMMMTPTSSPECSHITNWGTTRLWLTWGTHHKHLPRHHYHHDHQHQRHNHHRHNRHRKLVEEGVMMIVVQIVIIIAITINIITNIVTTINIVNIVVIMWVWE